MKRVMVAIAILAVLFSCVGCGKSNNVSNSSKNTLSIGCTVKIKKKALAGVSKVAFDQLVKYTNSLNTEAVQKMIVIGQIIVLSESDYGELLKYESGWVRIKLISGIYTGREAFTYVEEIVCVPADEARNAMAKKDAERKKYDEELLAYNNIGKYDLSKISKTDVTNGKREVFRNWKKKLLSVTEDYAELDKKAINVMNEFKTGKDYTKAQIKDLMGEMEEIRLAVVSLKIPQGFSDEITDELNRMKVDYQNGNNDRQAGLWKIAMFNDGIGSRAVTISGIDSCIKTSGEFFMHYQRRMKEFDRIFE